MRDDPFFGLWKKTIGTPGGLNEMTYMGRERPGETKFPRNTKVSNYFIRGDFVTLKGGG